MKEKLGWFCCFLLVIGFGFFYFSQSSQATVKETWEYSYITKRNEEPINIQEINRFGQEGWEMFTTLPSNENKLMNIFFKRKKQ